MDKDENYTQMLASYVRGGQFAESVALACFSQLEALRQYLELTERGRSLVLLHESLTAEQASLQSKAHVVLLSESAEYEEGGIEGKIAKYQPLDRFFARLASIYASMRRGGLDDESGSSSCRATAIYSAAGGAGKTTVAMNLAKHLAEQGRRVIILNLEALGSVSAFISEVPVDRFARLMYCLRSDPKRLAEQLGALIHYDEALKISVISSGDNAQELHEMTAEDVCHLIRCLKSSEAYEDIIIDLDSSLHERTWGALRESDRICWILLDDEACRHKTGIARQEIRRCESRERIRLIDKTCCWVNKFTGKMHSGLDQICEPEGYLPYIPEWKAVVSGQQLLSSRAFREQLAKLWGGESARREGGDEKLARSAIFAGAEV